MVASKPRPGFALRRNRRLPDDLQTTDAALSLAVVALLGVLEHELQGERARTSDEAAEEAVSGSWRVQRHLSEKVQELDRELDAVRSTRRGALRALQGEVVFP